MQEIRNYAFNDVVARDSTKVDSAYFFKSVDSFFVSYNIRGIYLVHNGDNGPSQFLFGIILINVDSRESFINMLTGELAHAEQWSKRPLSYLSETIKPVFSALFRSIFERKKYKAEAEKLAKETGRSRVVTYWWVAYQRREYKDPNSFEFEAHEIIEPKIKKLLWGPVKEKKEIIATN